MSVCMCVQDIQDICGMKKFMIFSHYLPGIVLGAYIKITLGNNYYLYFNDKNAEKFKQWN